MLVEGLRWLNVSVRPEVIIAQRARYVPPSISI